MPQQNLQSLELAPLLPRPRRINPARPAQTLPPQGYRIHVDRNGCAATEAADEAGRFYARQTLKQLRRACGRRLPPGVIEDWPDFPVRGVMLDISRDKVPTMKTLFAAADLFAELKINHLELYTEHTFAYRRHRDVWKNASPMTAAQVRKLDAYCRARHIELVPNQNTFGHMHRWLKLPRYRNLAECPNGYVTPWSEKRSDPFSLNPLDPRSLALVRELLAELLPNFESRLVNVGCDETFDLGQGRSKSACDRRGKGRVYLDYLKKIHRLTAQHGRAMHFWGDIILNHPELIPELPRDCVPLVWGYEANHPFEEQCRKFRDAGLNFYVCPGTSTWNSIAGRTDNALKNLRAAARAGLKFGARGYLITDWGDNGHWQPWVISWLPIAAGASFAWSLKANPPSRLESAANAQLFRDPAQTLAGVLLDLGNAHLKTNRKLFNASVLFRLLHQNDIATLAKEIGPARLRRAAREIQNIFARLARAKPRRADGKLILQEATLAGAMLNVACVRALQPKPAQLKRDLSIIVQQYRTIWRRRNRPGGLADSTIRLQNRLSECS